MQPCKIVEKKNTSHCYKHKNYAIELDPPNQSPDGPRHAATRTHFPIRRKKPAAIETEGVQSHQTHGDTIIRFGRNGNHKNFAFGQMPRTGRLRSSWRSPSTVQLQLRSVTVQIRVDGTDRVNAITVFFYQVSLAFRLEAIALLGHFLG